MTTFENWCALRGVQPLPAAPTDVASFVAECAELGIEKLWPLVGEISRAHYTVGLADPTVGGWVARAINGVSKIEPPRSWPKDQKGRFLMLPYDVQVYVLAHDTQREKEIRRAQNEAAAAKQKLAAVTSPVATLLEQREQTDGNTSHAAA